jgi:hypothetical protein
MGEGGDASSQLEALNPGGGALALAAEAHGGAGGLRQRGGSASAAAVSRSDGHADVSVSALAAGGVGGFFTPAGSRAGDGGAAQLGPVYGESSGGGAVSVVGEAAGGAGGGSTNFGSGTGGDGVSVELVDAVGGATSGALSLLQRARGGDGGNTTTGTPGLAGQARSALTHTADVASLSLVSEAFGGAGGRVSRGSSTGSDGADAEAHAEGENSAGALRVGGSAVAGRGGSSSASHGGAPGAGGDAQARFIGQTRGDGQRLEIGSEMLRSWGAFGGDGGSGAGASLGGSATSSSSGIALGASEVMVFDRAIAGSGGGAVFMPPASGGGDAWSTAFGSTASSERVDVGALAVGGSSNGRAEANATARGFGRAEATATAQGGATSGGFGSGRKHALADASGVSALAAAGAASIDPGPFRSGPRSEIAVLASVEGTGRLLAESDLGFQSDGLAMPGAEISAAAFALAAPDAAATAAVLAGDPRLEARLGPGSGAVPIALATLGGGAPPAPGGGPFSVTTSLELTLEAAVFGADPLGRLPLALGLADPFASSGGFDSLRFEVVVEGRSLLEQTFTDAALAISFFDDHLLRLGGFVPESDFLGVLDVRIALELTAEDPGSAFFATMLVAGGVAEPGTVGLVALGLACALARRRPGGLGSSRAGDER